MTRARGSCCAASPRASSCMRPLPALSTTPAGASVPTAAGMHSRQGHVALVTSGAAFLQDRYGWRYGLPAYALAGYVADVRVRTGHHRWRDVVGGVAVGWGVSKFFV